MPANKKAPAKKTSGKKKSAPKGASAAQARKKQPKRREIGALVCIFLCILTFAGYFSSDGWAIDVFRKFIGGLVGKGFYILPPAFLLAAYILVFHRGRPVRLRVFCSMMLPVVIGAMLHLFSCTTEFKWESGLIPALYSSGVAEGSACSGGVIGGIIALSFKTLFGSIVSSVILIVALLFLLIAAFNISIPAIVDWFRGRERAEYEYIPEPEKPRPEKRKAAPPADNFAPEEPKHAKTAEDNKARSGRVIDFPVDGPISADTENAPRKEEKKSFFNRTPAVPTPDKIISEHGVPVSAQEPIKPEPEKAPAAVDSAAVNPGEFKPLQEELEEKRAEKLREEAELKAASEQVAQEIEGSLETATEEYIYPPTDLLAPPAVSAAGDGKTEVEMNSRRLEATIQSFGINASLCGVTRGPSVTRYEVELEQGVKLAKLTNLADDIALSLGATGVRIAPIPNKISIVGIEVPNKVVNVVALREIIESPEFTEKKSKLSFAVGKDISGKPIVGDISKLPHLLIAGTTGSGKSVCMNSLILSLLYKASPEEVRLIMVDPKMVELGIYNEIPHLLIPVVTDPKKAAGALQWAVVEMLKRYKLFSDLGVRDLASYNSVIIKTEGGQTMPQIVVLIDELADLMTVAAKDVEESICRIAQMGRASGIHLVIATQRPSADVITGLMKANIPSRIAFAVQDAINSRIILDTTGAEKLVGKGDMLYFPLGSGKPQRVQGTFVTDDEREKIVNFVKERSTAHYSENILEEIEKNAAKDSKGSKKDADEALPEVDDEVDELFNSAVEVILETKQASVSMLQRRLKLGYSRAARLVDQMEQRGILGPFEGSKPRQILITREKWDEILGIAPAAPQQEETPPEVPAEDAPEEQNE